MKTLDNKEIIHFENNPESQHYFELNKSIFSNQCAIVFEALKRGERLTTGSAYSLYNIGDLRRRIKDLKDTYKIPIKSRYINGRFKEYFLKE